MNQKTSLKFASIDLTHQSFFYESSNKCVLLSNDDWPTPITIKNKSDNDSDAVYRFYADYLLSKIINIAIEAKTITLSKQLIYRKVKNVFKSISPFNKTLIYLSKKNYLQLTIAGKTGRKQFVILNPKIFLKNR